MPTEKRSNTDRRENDVTHGTLLEKLVEHDGAISNLTVAIEHITEKLDPIADGVRSIAFVFKVFVAVGALAASTTGILVLIEKLNGG